MVHQSMSDNSKEAILAAARRAAQAHGYGGLNFRGLATEVGIKAASIYHYFPSKADLGSAVARRYGEDTAKVLEALSTEAETPGRALHRYPETFRRALTMDNRICLASFMAADYDDLPDAVKNEVRSFTEVNVSWLSQTLSAALIVNAEQAEPRAQAIFAAIAGAQLMAQRPVRYRSV